MSNPVYDDTFVIITSNDKMTYYYNPHSVEVDDTNHIIKVWIKLVFTDKGKQDLLETYKDDNFRYIDYDLLLFVINYNKMIYNIKEVIHYYILSDKIIDVKDTSDKWKDIIPGSFSEGVLNIFYDNNTIKR